MNIVSWVFLSIITFGVGLFVKNFLPSYMDEKGKNLATKEDIQEITKKTEEVQQEFKESFEMFSNDVQFKYDFYYKQYSELYSKLYSIIIQSEYVRHFLYLSNKKVITFEDTPFLEISPTRRQTQEIKLEAGKPITAKQKIEEIKTPISEFNKKQLCDYIIDNGHYASQSLLKLAVSYRFAYSYYSGNPEVNNGSCEDIANEEEVRLIREIVHCIIREYNQIRKELKIEYSSEELENGILQL